MQLKQTFLISRAYLLSLVVLLLALLYTGLIDRSNAYDYGQMAIFMPFYLIPLTIASYLIFLEVTDVEKYRFGLKSAGVLSLAVLIYLYEAEGINDIIMWISISLAGPFILLCNQNVKESLRLNRSVKYIIVVLCSLLITEILLNEIATFDTAFVFSYVHIPPVGVVVGILMKNKVNVLNQIWVRVGVTVTMIIYFSLIFSFFTSLELLPYAIVAGIIHFVAVTISLQGSKNKDYIQKI